MGNVLGDFTEDPHSKKINMNFSLKNEYLSALKGIGHTVDLVNDKPSYPRPQYHTRGGGGHFGDKNDNFEKKINRNCRSCQSDFEGFL